MTYLLLGFALLAGLLLAGRWFVAADPRTVIKVLKWVLIGLIVAVAVFFLLSGRIGLAIAALPALLPWFIRGRAAYRAAKNFSRMAGGASGQTSEIRSRHLEMSLDHDSGEMTGRIVAGNHAGRDLGDLSLDVLTALFAEYAQDDDESARLLAAFLDRNHPDWRSGAAKNEQSEPSSRPTAGMSRDEAFKVLGLAEGASGAEIRAAHHRLIASLHPDKGGSAYLAAKINEARDVLLG